MLNKHVVAEKTWGEPGELLIDGNVSARERVAHECGLRFVCYTSLSQVETIWRTFELEALHTPFQTFAWVSHWFEHVGRHCGAQPMIVCGYSQDDLVILLPMMREHFVGGSRLTWPGFKLADYNAPIVKADYFKQLTVSGVEALWQQVGSVLPGKADYAYLVKHAAFLGPYKNPFAEFMARPFSAQAHATKLAADWKSHYANLRSGRTRRRLRMKEKSLAGLGTVAFERITDAGARADFLTTVLAWKTEQLKGRGSTNPFSDPRVFEFYHHYATDPHVADNLHIIQLTLDGKPIIGTVCLANGPELVIYQTAYTPGPHMRYSPGMLMIIKLMEYAIAQGFQVLDFALGDEAYKLEWCERHLPSTITIMPFTLKGRLFSNTQHWRMDLKHAIKTRPRLLHAMEIANRWQTRLRGSQV